MWYNSVSSVRLHTEYVGSLVKMNLRKLLIFAGVALLLFFLIAEPQQAAQLVVNILGFLGGAAESIILFIKNVFSGFAAV